jgi:hypothetical protein
MVRGLWQDYDLIASARPLRFRVAVTLAVLATLLVGGKLAESSKGSVIRFSVRALVSVSSVPCTGDALRGSSSVKNSCFDVGKAAVDADDVRSVQIVEEPAQRWSVQVDLERRAGKRWRQLFGGRLGEKLAIVVNGRVVSTPTIAESHPSLSLYVSDNLSAKTARRLAKTIGHSTRVKTRRADPEITRAAELCDRLSRMFGPHAGVLAASPRTAGEIVDLAREIGVDPQGWDTYPASHFVAGCSLTPADFRPENGPPIPRQLLVDEDLQVTSDPLTTDDPPQRNGHQTSPNA